MNDEREQEVIEEEAADATRAAAYEALRKVRADLQATGVSQPDADAAITVGVARMLLDHFGHPHLAEHVFKISLMLVVSGVVREALNDGVLAALLEHGALAFENGKLRPPNEAELARLREQAQHEAQLRAAQASGKIPEC